MLVPKTSNKKKEFVKHMKELNRSFYDWFKSCVTKDPSQFMNDAVQDYIDYATQLEDRYLRSFGEVMTFGSGDCGQLAHGVENDEDLMVRFPRIVYSLRYPIYVYLHTLQLKIRGFLCCQRQKGCGNCMWWTPQCRVHGRWPCLYLGLCG